jgi:hypothetical protein
MHYLSKTIAWTDFGTAEPWKTSNHRNSGRLLKQSGDKCTYGEFENTSFQLSLRNFPGSFDSGLAMAD